MSGLALSRSHAPVFGVLAALLLSLGTLAAAEALADSPADSPADTSADTPADSPADTSADTSADTAAKAADDDDDDGLIPPERARMARRYADLADLLEGGEILPHWRADGSAFWYVEGAPAKTVALAVDPATGETTPLFDTPRLRAVLAERLGHHPPFDGLPFSEFTLADDERKARFQVAGRTFTIDLASHELEEVETPPTPTPPGKIRDGFSAGSPPVMEKPSPDGRFALTEQGHDLWLRASIDGRLQPLTRGGEEDHAWSVQGALWSPDSHRLLVFANDERGLDRIPVVHWLKTAAEVELFPYTKAGGPAPQREAWVVHALSRHAVRVDIPDAHDSQIFAHSWRADGSEVLLLVMDRRYQHLRLLAADATTGKTRQVLEERSATFIGGLRFLIDWRGMLEPLADGEHFLWLAERDGWRHLDLYRFDGQRVRPLTRGNFEIREIVAVDEGDGPGEGWVYVLANPDRERPYDTHLVRVPLGGGPPEQLTEAEGEHEVAMAPSKRYFLDTYSSPTRPPVVEWRRADGTLVRELSRADPSKLEGELSWQPPETFVTTAADGETKLHGVLYRPWDFDPTRRYPVVDHIYNGPFITWAPQTFLDRRALQAQELAQLGFVVLVMDGRGTPERGKAFQDVVYQAFGENEIPDHAAALEQLAAERPWMDLARVGIHGGSWGGYMTIRALLLRPDLFRVGVALNSVSDLWDHAHQIEGYMGLPEDAPQAYARASCHRLAHQLEGKLLLIHGTSDVNATFSSVMKMTHALVEADKPVDMLVIPEQSHWFTGQARDYANQARERYLVEHLRPYGE